MNIDRDLLKRYDDAERPAPRAAGPPPLPPASSDGRRPIADLTPPSRPVATPVQTAPPRPAVVRPPAPVLVTTPKPPLQPKAEPVPTPKPPKPAGDTNISINITMPTFKKPTLPDWQWRKIGIWAGVAVGVFILSLVAHALISTAIQKHKEYEAKHQINMIQQRQTPSFTPVVPKNNTAVAKTAAYDSRRDSYSYNDTLKGLQLIVSQQPLPAGASTATVARIAKSMNATTPLITDRGTAYIASNSGGAQTIVMGSGSLLIFVQSAFAHSSDDWKSYLDTLQA